MAARAPAMNEAIAGFPYRTGGMLMGELDRRTQTCLECIGAPVDENMPFGIGVRIPAPKKLPGFPSAKPVKKKTPVQGGGGLRARWKDEKGNIYEWDSQHGKEVRQERKAFRGIRPQHWRTNQISRSKEKSGVLIYQFKGGDIE